MASDPIESSEINEYAYRADFLKLACGLDILEDLLRSALKDAARLIRQSPPSVRPADKKALRGLAKLLSKTTERLSETGVRERLEAAVFEEPEKVDADDYDYYCAWSDARRRVDQAIKGTNDLLEIVHRGEEINLLSGRSAYDHCGAAILSLLSFWIEDLQREVTISAHAADARKVNPSPALQFVHGAMLLIGQEMPEQTCRRMLEKFREEFGNSEMKPWN